MNINFKEIRNIFSIYLLMILIIEVSSRVIFSLLASSYLPFLYGTDSRINLIYKNGRKSKPLFIFKQELDLDNYNYKRKNQIISNSGIYITTGGSTTYGRACSKDSSSWPEQLSLLINKEIYNHAKSGTNSDYALRDIDYMIKTKKPEKIFFANWINERDIMTLGPKLNKEKLLLNHQKVIQEINNSSDKNKYYTLSFDKTLKNYSLFYVGLSNVISKILGNTNIRNAEQKIFDENFQNMSIENYLINVEYMLEKSKQYNFELIIVRPPVNWTRYSFTRSEAVVNEVKKWDKLMIKNIKDYTNENQLKFINVQYKNDKETMDIFCDAFHQTLAGNRKTAEIINNEYLD